MQEVGRVEVSEVQGWRRGGEGRRPGREEVVNRLLDPVVPGERESLFSQRD